MGGRKLRGGPGSHRAAAVVGSDVTGLEEPCTRSNGESQGGPASWEEPGGVQ